VVARVGQTKRGATECVTHRATAQLRVCLHQSESVFSCLLGPDEYLLTQGIDWAPTRLPEIIASAVYVCLERWSPLVPISDVRIGRIPAAPHAAAMSSVPHIEGSEILPATAAETSTPGSRTRRESNLKLR
jgi:hypothetical protein